MSKGSKDSAYTEQLLETSNKYCSLWNMLNCCHGNTPGEQGTVRYSTKVYTLLAEQYSHDCSWLKDMFI